MTEKIFSDKEIEEQIYTHYLDPDGNIIAIYSSEEDFELPLKELSKTQNKYFEDDTVKYENPFTTSHKSRSHKHRRRSLRDRKSKIEFQNEQHYEEPKQISNITTSTIPTSEEDSEFENIKESSNIQEVQDSNIQEVQDSNIQEVQDSNIQEVQKVIPENAIKCEMTYDDNKKVTDAFCWAENKKLKMSLTLESSGDLPIYVDINSIFNTINIPNDIKFNFKSQNYEGLALGIVDDDKKLMIDMFLVEDEIDFGKLKFPIIITSF